MEFITINENNINDEHLCCIIRSKVKHIGIENKRKWLDKQLPYGHTFYKLNDKSCCFIEYAPLEYAWVPVRGNNYFYIYCLWCDGDVKNKGYGKKLIEHCINDAKAKHKDGICVLAATKQKHWLTSQDFLKKYGFKKVDKTDYGYELLALSFNDNYPNFTDKAKQGVIDDKALNIYYDDQCPFIPLFLDKIAKYCDNNHLSYHFNYVDSLEKAKNSPAVFNNWATFY